jgi:hypothetical protein
MTATVTSFPHSKVAGQVPQFLPSPADLFIYSSHGGVPLPPSSGAFHMTTTVTSFPPQGCWVVASTPAFSGRLVYLQVT